MFVQRWNTKYPQCPWIDSDVEPYKWVDTAKDGTITTHTTARRMGLLALHGSWTDVVAADGTPITVTRLANSAYIDAGAFTDVLKARVSKGGDLQSLVCRLVERSADGADSVVSTCAAGRFVFDKKKNQFRSFQSKPLPDADQHGLVLQVLDGDVVNRFAKTDATMVRKLLCNGLESFDVSLLHAVLTDSSEGGHKLLGEVTDFPDLRVALGVMKDDRNEIVGHGEMRGATDDEFKRSIDHIHAFLDACVDTYKLFDEKWKSHLTDAVTNATTSEWTGKIELVCRTPLDFVKRSHREAKTLFPAQVDIFFHIIDHCKLVFCTRLSQNNMHLVSVPVYPRITHSLGGSMREHWKHIIATVLFSVCPFAHHNFGDFYPVF